MSECHFQPESRIQPLIYLSRGPLSELRDLVSGKKSTTAKYMTHSAHVGWPKYYSTTYIVQSTTRAKAA